jgi:hypothetical protein
MMTGATPATAAGFGDRPAPRRMILRAWRLLIKNTLRGFAAVELRNGLRIRDISVHVHQNGTAWAGMPGKPQLEDGRVKVDAHGKPRYSAIVDWRDKALRERFSAAVVELVRAHHPGDL